MWRRLRRLQVKTKVFLKGVKVHVNCGVYRDERSIGVDAKMDVEVESVGFVDYEELYRTVREASRGEFEYVENLLESVAAAVMKRWKVKVIKLRLSKLSLPFENFLEAAGVEMEWKGD